jgi:hypothetical protein
VKYADHLALLVKEEAVLQGMIETLIDMRRCCGIEMNMEKTKVIRTSHIIL